jgi:AraC-like DNA-binding protein
VQLSTGSANGNSGLTGRTLTKLARVCLGRVMPSFDYREYKGPQGRELAMEPGLFTETRAFALSHQGGRMTTETASLDNGIKVSRVVSSGHYIDLTETQRASIILPTRGRIDVATEDAEFSAVAGEGLVFGPNSRRTRVVAPRGDLYAAMVLLVPTWLLSANGADGPRPLREGRLRRASGRLLGGLVDDLSVVLDSASKGVPSLQGGASRVLDLYGDLFSEGNGLAPTGRLDERRLRLAVQFIAASFHEPLTVADIARAAGVSVRVLQTGFHTLYGRPPMAYLNAVRMAAVRRRLLDPNARARVTQIALDCGFTHLGRFAGAYAAIYGEVPSATRNMGRWR